MSRIKKEIFKNGIQYRSELWDNLFFDNCLNYPNLNYVSEKIFSSN